MTNRPYLVWFRNDLRLADNPALIAAASSGQPVACLYVLDDSPKRRAPGGASRWWLHHSLKALEQSLRRLGSRLLIVKGDPAEVLPRIAAGIGANRACWNRRYGAAEIALDTGVKSALRAGDVDVQSFNGNLLREPWQVQSKVGQPMKVFTPFWRAAQAIGPFDSPLPAPAALAGFDWPEWHGLSIEDLNLLPAKPDWAGGLRTHWQPGEAGAMATLTAFFDDGFKGYAEDRNLPDRRSTSRLSPYLAFGEISPRQVSASAAMALETGQTRASERDLSKLMSEIGWREFAYHLLFNNPDLATRNYQPKFDAFPWRSDPSGLRAWQRGRTGYPIVDAGMRELWRTGWMHNRVRMITASFLIKHLLIDWREGERWFWDTLVDADPANNAASWQWVAGSGADAAPYYRIFNPMLQGTKFDAAGDYVRQWAPELAKLPAEHIHAPWQAPPHILARAGVVLGKTYPRPIVDHDAARARALSSLKQVSGDQAIMAGFDG